MFPPTFPPSGARHTFSVNDLQRAVERRVSQSGELPRRGRPLTVEADTKVIIRDDHSKKKLMGFWFHTAFVNGKRLVLTKPELDGPHHDKHHEKYDEDFTVTVFFETKEETSARNVIADARRGSLLGRGGLPGLAGLSPKAAPKRAGSSPIQEGSESEDEGGAGGGRPTSGKSNSMSIVNRRGTTASSVYTTSDPQAYIDSSDEDPEGNPGGDESPVAHVNLELKTSASGNAVDIVQT